MDDVKEHFGAFRVCGDCASVLLGADCERSSKPEHAEIGLGVMCETHSRGGLAIPQATSIFEASEKLIAILFPSVVDLGGGAGDVHEVPAARTLGGTVHEAAEVWPVKGGALTTVATELFAAMIAAGGPDVAADPMAVEQACRVARTLLRDTRGA
jgi:hypothetical protein